MDTDVKSAVSRMEKSVRAHIERVSIQRNQPTLTLHETLATLPEGNGSQEKPPGLLVESMDKKTVAPQEPVEQVKSERGGDGFSIWLIKQIFSTFSRDR